MIQGLNTTGLAEIQERDTRDAEGEDHSRKAAICKPRRELSPEANPVSTLILDFPASRAVRNKILWFKLPGLYGTLLWQPELPIQLRAAISWLGVSVLQVIVPSGESGSVCSHSLAHRKVFNKCLLKNDCHCLCHPWGDPPGWRGTGNSRTLFRDVWRSNRHPDSELCSS